MKTNPIKLGVELGELQIVTWINMLRNPAALAMFKEVGLDFVRLDMEHSSPSIETVSDFAVMGRALDMPVMVRPPEANREWITRLLDIGIYNIHFYESTNNLLLNISTEDDNVFTEINLEINFKLS